MNWKKPSDAIYFIAHTRHRNGTAFSSDPEPGYYVVETHRHVALAGPFDSRREAPGSARNSGVAPWTGPRQTTQPEPSTVPC